jgi:uncharacterized low-complexity protein
MLAWELITRSAHLLATAVAAALLALDSAGTVFNTITNAAKNCARRELQAPSDRRGGKCNGRYKCAAATTRKTKAKSSVNGLLRNAGSSPVLPRDSTCLRNARGGAMLNQFSRKK